jgi:filamentous hemagglutinin family protein
MVKTNASRTMLPRARSRRLVGLRALLAALIAAPSTSWANPSGGVVVSGTAGISSAGKTLTVQQISNLAIIDWNTFSINSGELTKFLQPSVLAAALNRVTGGDPSAIYGTLQANGRVYLINPNGVTVGPSGVINAQSFVASSLDVTNTAFLAGGDLVFSGASLAGVSNAGQINALGGDILLVAHTVQNTGALNASGTAAMAAGSEVLFAAAGNQRVFVQAGSGSAAVGVDQEGQIQAATAELAAAGGNIYGVAVNNGGSVQATGVNNVGGQIFLTATGGAVSDSGSLSATGQGGQVTVTGGQISLGGNVTSNGAQTYIGPVLLTANDSLTGNGISFQGTVDGAEALTLNPGQGTASFDGVVGGNTPLAALTVTGVTDEEGGASTTSGDQTFNGAFIANPVAALTSNSGSLNFGGSVNVGGSLTTNSAVNTTFNGPVSLGSNLTANITSSAGAVDLNGGSITGGGTQTYNGPVKLGADNTLAPSDGGYVDFNGTVDGGYNLTVESHGGKVAFNGAVGGSAPLDSLNVAISQVDDGNHIILNGGAITTVGNQTYSGPVVLGLDNTLTSQNGSLYFTGTDGSAQFGTVDGAQNLTINAAKGSVSFDGAVGQSAALTGLSITGTTDVEGGAITTSGDQTFNGAFIANPSAVLTSQSGSLDFNGSVNVGNNLTTNSAKFTTFNGPAFFGGGLTANITSAAGSINLGYGSLDTLSPGTVTSGGDQTYNGPVFVGNWMDLSSLYGNLTFNGPLNGISATANTEVEANLITNSAWNTSFNGPVTMGTLTSNISGPGAVNFNIGSVATVFDQTYNGTVNAQQDTTLTSSEGNIIFNGPLNAGFNLTTNSTLNTDFNGPVFLGNSLTAHTADGTINLRGGLVTSGGDQTYNGPVILGSDNVLSSLYGNLNFNGTVNGAHALTTNSDWNTNFNQAVGGGTPLETLISNIIAPGQLSVNGGPGHINVDGGSLVTSGDQTYNGPVYAQPSTVLTSNAGNLNFNQTVNAGNFLTTNSALNTNFNGAVFLGDGLTSNITSPSGLIILNGGSIVSGGDQVYNGPISIPGSDVTLNSLFGNLTINGSIEGQSTINSGIGALTTISAWNTTFNGTADLEWLTSTARAIDINSGLIFTWGGQTYNGPIQLLGNTFLNDEGSAIVFNGTIDGNYNLSLQTSGALFFNAPVGSIAPLLSLNVRSWQNLYLNAGAVTTSGDQTYDYYPGVPTNGVVFGSNTTLTSTAGNLNFIRPLDGDYNLTTNSYLNTNFYAPVGSNTPLETLTANITGPGGIYLHGNTVTTTGAQTYNGPLTR